MGRRRRSFYACVLPTMATVLLLALEASSGSTETRGHGFDGGGEGLNSTSPDSTSPAPDVFNNHTYELRGHGFDGGGEGLNSTSPDSTSPAPDVFNNHTYELRCSPRLRLLVDGCPVDVTGAFRGVLRVLCLLTRSAAQEGHLGVTPPARAGRAPGFRFGFLVTEDLFNANNFRADNDPQTQKRFDLVFSDGLPSDPNDFSSFSYSCQYRIPGHYFAVGERRLKARSVAWVLLARLACREWWEGLAPPDSEEDCADGASEDSEESALNAFNRRLRSALKASSHGGRPAPALASAPRGDQHPHLRLHPHPHPHPRPHLHPHPRPHPHPHLHQRRRRPRQSSSRPPQRRPRGVRDNVEPTHGPLGVVTTTTIHSYEIRCNFGREVLSANGIPLMITKHMQVALKFACAAVPARLRMSGAPISLGPIYTKNNFNPDDYAVNSSAGYRVDVEYADGRKRFGRFLYPLHVRCGESPKVSVRGRALVKHTLAWALLAASRCGGPTPPAAAPAGDDEDSEEESNEIDDDATRWRLLQNLRPPARHPFNKHPTPVKQGRESMGSPRSNQADLSLSSDNQLSSHDSNIVTDYSTMRNAKSSSSALPQFPNKHSFVPDTHQKELLSENSVRYDRKYASDKVSPGRMDEEVLGPALSSKLTPTTPTIPPTPCDESDSFPTEISPMNEIPSPSPDSLPSPIPVTSPSDALGEESPSSTSTPTSDSTLPPIETTPEAFRESEGLLDPKVRHDGTLEGANDPWIDVFHHGMDTEDEDSLASNRLGTRGVFHRVEEDAGELLPKPERLDSEMDLNGVILEDDCLDNEDDPHNHSYSLRCAESASLSVDGSEVRVSSHMAAALFFLCALLSSAQGARTAEFDFGSIRTIESFRTEDVALYSGGDGSLDVLYDGNTQPRSHDVNIFWQTCRPDPPGPEFSLDSGPLLPHSLVWSLFSKVRCGGDRDDASAGAERYFNDDVIPEERSSEESVASYSNWHNYVIRCVPGNESLIADTLELQMTAHMQTALSLLCFSSGLHALNATRNLGRIRSVEVFNPEEYSAVTNGGKRIDVLYKDNISRSDDRVSSMMPECQARPPRFFVNEQEIRAGGVLWRLYRSLLCGASELSDSAVTDSESEWLMYEEHPTPLYVASNVHSYAVRCRRGGERLLVDGARVRATRHLQAVLRFLCDVVEVSVPQPVPELYSFGNIATREAFATAEFATEAAAGRSFDVQYVQPTLRADRQPTSLRSMCEPEAQFTLDGHRLAPHTLVWSLFRHLRCGESQASQSHKSS